MSDETVEYAGQQVKVRPLQLSHKQKRRLVRQLQTTDMTPEQMRQALKRQAAINTWALLKNAMFGFYYGGSGVARLNERQ